MRKREKEKVREREKVREGKRKRKREGEREITKGMQGKDRDIIRKKYKYIFHDIRETTELCLMV